MLQPEPETTLETQGVDEDGDTPNGDATGDDTGEIITVEGTATSDQGDGGD